MASSQVEIASSSPFGCVLRDHNRREPPCRDSNAQAAFHNNLKVFVRDHARPSISIIPSDENSHPPPAAFYCWIPQQQGIRHRRRSLSFRTNREEKSKDMSGRESEIMDQWVTRQAQETVSTTERHTHEAQLLSPSQFPPDHSPSQSSNSPDVPNLGASSLVQMWEARVSRSDSLNSLAVSRTNSGFSYTEIAEEPSSRPSEVCEPAGERYDTHTNNGDSYPDWDSERTAPSDQPLSSQGQDSDAGENERVRVADIIRRLTSGKHRAQNSLMCCSDDNDHEQPVVTSPRLRGRQAYINLLTQMEHDRQRELGRVADCQAVSRFPHRGRIQSMLRLRFLHQGMTVHDQLRPMSRGSELGPSQGSGIMLLRERFSTGVEHGSVTAQSCVPNSRSPPNNTLAFENSPTSNQISEDIHRQEVSTSEPQSTTSAEQLMSYATEYVQEDAGPSSDTWQGPSFEVGSLDSQEQETADRMTTLNNWDMNINAEEEEVGELNLFGTHYDWFSEISRPRRYWEDLRQAWYQEMLESNSDNEEIRQLLERRRVSTFLASDFRERMDQLMTSHLQQQLHPEGSQREVELEEERRRQEISVVHQSCNTSDYFNEDTSSLQLPSPSLFRSGGQFQNQEVSDDSDQVPSSSLQLHPSLSPSASPSAPQFYYQGSPQSSSITSRPSITYRKWISYMI
ncbi:uncharacterized protein LOC117906208 isoform X2 [Vitis riparia]|uniref:uncharacterized protein LOC117906208 isoform X2 n=1 Tax=Vitis riparia TaxID=96939 RepID=UPI00155ADBFD|nr:uncharacterized protein LOC117906208 isoform X2 [Vitis riparia]